MLKRVNFGPLVGDYWPTINELSTYFLAPKGKEWSYQGLNDNWGLSISGLYGTSHLTPYAMSPGNVKNTRVEAWLTMWGDPELGVLLYYNKFGNEFAEHYFSAGDLSKLNVWVRTLMDDLRPVGLYVPFREAWPAVKEFMEREGELPRSITWVRPQDLPPNTFPDPFDKVPEIETHGYPWETDPTWWARRNDPATR